MFQVFARRAKVFTGLTTEKVTGNRETIQFTYLTAVENKQIHTVF